VLNWILQEEQERRLEALRMQVAITAERDPDRLLKPTRAQEIAQVRQH
jgi:hypothetical protein